MKITTVVELVVKFVITLVALSGIVLMGVIGGGIVIVSSIIRGLK